MTGGVGNGLGESVQPSCWRRTRRSGIDGDPLQLPMILAHVGSSPASWGQHIQGQLHSTDRRAGEQIYPL
jgi:hypothetical protein